MSLALCAKCLRFARPHAACPFCGTSIGAPRPRARIRASRSAIVAATAAILACGGTVSGSDSGADDAAIDGPKDSGMIDQASGFDAAIMPDASDARMDTGLPPPPYGSPPVPDD